MGPKLAFSAVTGVAIGMATGLIAFQSLGSGLGIGIAMAAGICGVTLALGTEERD